MTTSTGPREVQEELIEAAAHLEKLLCDLSSRTENCDLLCEHLQSAKASLRGCMPAEYQFSLAMAREASTCVSDPGLRNEITRFIDQQLRACEPAPRRSTEED
jgi:hypothetical protein